MFILSLEISREKGKFKLTRKKHPAFTTLVNRASHLDSSP